MNVLFSVVNELQSTASVVPIVLLFVIRASLVPAYVTVLSTCEDYDVDCSEWAALADEDCDAWLRSNCEVSCKMCEPRPSDRVPARSIQKEEPQPRCTNRYTLCERWTRQGECNGNPSFMHVQCCLSCATKTASEY
uniref:ShKT domain-containing protein n=1 Tax=Ascaris lumbricoides TaxID=6252 RepID=A0A0M3HNM9_ASCLU